MERERLEASGYRYQLMKIQHTFIPATDTETLQNDEIDALFEYIEDDWTPKLTCYKGKTHEGVRKRQYFENWRNERC